MSTSCLENVTRVVHKVQLTAADKEQQSVSLCVDYEMCFGIRNENVSIDIAGYFSFSAFCINCQNAYRYQLFDLDACSRYVSYLSSDSTWKDEWWRVLTPDHKLSMTDVSSQPNRHPKY